MTDEEKQEIMKLMEASDNVYVDSKWYPANYSELINWIEAYTAKKVAEAKGKWEHICVNTTMPGWELDKAQSIPDQILRHYQDEGWQLCAVDGIYYFFRR